MKHQIGSWVAACMLGMLGLAGVAQAEETLNIGSRVPTVDDVRQGLFPEEECEQLRAAGFKCMGFKPAVKFSLPAVAFKRGSAELPDGLKKQLDVFAEALSGKAATQQKLRIEGHADASGDATVNVELSQRRAEVGSNDLMDRANPTSAENRRVVIARDPITQ